MVETVGSIELLNVLGVLRSVGYYGIVQCPTILLTTIPLKTLHPG